MRPRFLQQVMRQTALLAAGLGMAALAHAGPYSSLYVFGDSLSDAGNVLQITGGAAPVASIYTDGTNTGRFTNGLSYVDHLAKGLGLSAAPSLQGGTNYAFGGARVSYVNPGLPSTALSFNQQISAFTSSHASADAGGLYVLWIGANDMSDAIGAAVRGNPAAVQSAIGNAMKGIGGAIAELSSRGATHFLIPNLPDLSLVPAIRGVGVPQLSALAQNVSLSFNDALQRTLSHADFAPLDIRTFDVFQTQTDITANPTAYGLSNVTSACFTGEVSGAALPGGPTPTVCSAPQSYMYFDYEHPTAALHAVLGQQALAVAVPEPAQVLLFTLGLATLGGVARRRRCG
jgi:phospholipase/lecithinase/hemolysin